MESGIASFGFQRQINDSLQNGLFDGFMSDALRYVMLRSNGIATPSSGDINLENLMERINRRAEDRGGKRLSLAYNQAVRAQVQRVLKDGYKTSSEFHRRNSLKSIIRENEQYGVGVMMNDKDRTDAFTNKEGMARIDSKIAALNKALGFEGTNRLNEDDVIELVCYCIGYSRNNGEIKSITINQFESAMDHMIGNVNAGSDFIIDGKSYLGYDGGQRVRIALLPAGLGEKIWRSDKFRSRYETFSLFQQHCYDLVKKTTIGDIKQIDDYAKRQALYNILDAVSFDNGFDEVSGWSNGIDVNEMIDVAEKFGSSIQGWGFDFVEKYREVQRLQTENLKHIIEYESNSTSAVYDPQNGGSIVVYGKNKHDTAKKVADTLVNMRKLMGMTYIGLLPGNLLERTLHQKQVSAALKLGRLGFGPYAMDASLEIDRSIVDAVCNNAEFQEMFIAYREAERLGVDREFLFNVHNSKDIKEAIAKTFKEMSVIERIGNRLVDIANGKNTFIKGEIANFVDAFAMYSYQEGHSWWFSTSKEGGQNNLERALQDPIRWFSSCFMLKDGNASPSFGVVRRSMNFAKAGDMAQKNVLSAVYSEIAKYHSGINFLVCTLISPYVQYGTNRLGRIANLLAPISSLHYLVTKSAMSGAIGEVVIGNNGEQKVRIKDIPLDDVQVHSSLAQALAADMLHMGPCLLALLIISMIGAIEPPEDEDKWGNFKEWSYFGIRGDFPWWMEDVLGLTLPMAAFMRSAELGKPRFDLVVNGLTYYLSNNPAVKIADAVQVLFDPLAEIQADWSNDIEGYKKAMGGPPSLSDYINGKWTVSSLSFVSQFLTPGFLREIYNGAQRYEVSYKKVYQTDATGRLTQKAKEDNYTQYTDYADAIVRKYTRYNPMMGFLADLVIRPTTGYMAHEMPRTVIYDPMQMNSMEALSIYNDPWNKKDPKDYTEQLAIANEVVVLLQTYDTSELRSQGFMLDSDTREFVSEFIHDQIAALKNNWNDMKSSGELDYYALGEGSFELGRERYGELYDAYNAQVDFWKSLYYDKLWDKDLISMAQYNRVVTNYAQDADGNWYATGYKANTFAPFTIAPTPTPEGAVYQKVMSEDEDYAAQSIVTGESTGQRGLIPVEQGKVETPSLDSWGADGTDTSYSKSRQKNASYYSTSSSDFGTAGSSSSVYSRRGSSGYSGGSGGGGGGGSYGRFNSPNLGSTPKSYGAKYNTHRTQSTSFDYLRPNISTKGSRNPYKRSE